MSQETMLAAINAELKNADTATMGLILETLRRVKQPRPAAVFEVYDRREALGLQTPTTLHFIGENLMPAEYRSLPPHDRVSLQKRLKEQNALWLREQFSKRKAAWLVVVDGEVIACGETLANLPLAPQHAETARKTGKFPFVFINDDHIVIEENASHWHATNAPNDFYPTIPMSLSSSFTAIEIVGDFDTGASHSFADYDLLRARNLIRPEEDGYYEFSLHLSQPYHYIAKSLRFQLTARAGHTYVLDAKLHCVPDWQKSPFVRINPNRVALVGRDLLLALKPKVLLDFDGLDTEIQGKRKVRAATDKSAKAKSNSTKRRKRS